MGWRQWKECDECGSRNIELGMDDQLRAVNTCKDCGSTNVGWGLYWKYGESAESDKWYDSLIGRSA